MMKLSRSPLNLFPLFSIALLSACANAPVSLLDSWNFDYSPEEHSTTRHIQTTDLISLKDIGAYFGYKSVSPDGRSVAFQLQQADVENNRYRLGWFVSSISSPSTPRFVGDGGDVILSGEESGSISGGRLPYSAKWSPDSQWIAYRLKEGESVQLWQSHLDGGERRQLTNNASNVLQFDWSKDGDKVYFTVGPARAKLRSQRHAEAASGFLFDDRFLPIYSRHPVFSTDIDQKTLSLWVCDFNQRIERPATSQEQRDYEDLLSYPETTMPNRVRVKVVEANLQNRFAWLENEDPTSFPGFSPSLTMMARLEDNVVRRCSHQQCHGRLTSIFWSHSSDEVLFTKRESTNNLDTALYAWNPRSNRLRTILQTDDMIENCEFAVAVLVCIHESWTSPRTLITIDPSNGAIKTVFDPNPSFRDIAFTRVEELVTENTDGSTAVGHLVYPSNYEEDRLYPLVIVQYRSRGFLRGGVGDEFPIHPLAAHGHFVLSFERPEKQNVSQRIRDAWQAERENWGEDFWEKTSALAAIEAFVHQLQSRGLIAPDKVGLTGLSDGAETLWYSLIHSDIFATAAASEGGWPPSWYYLLDADSRQHYLRHAAELPPPGSGNFERWRQISPEFHAEEINTPILVQVADHEFIQSVPTIVALKDADQPIEAYVFPDEYHIKWQPKHKLAVYNRTIDWFNFWLRDVEDPNPEKAEQYQRWRRLKMSVDSRNGG